MVNLGQIPLKIVETRRLRNMAIFPLLRVRVQGTKIALCIMQILLRIAGIRHLRVLVIVASLKMLVLLVSVGTRHLHELVSKMNNLEDPGLHHLLIVFAIRQGQEPKIIVVLHPLDRTSESRILINAMPQICTPFTRRTVPLGFFSSYFG